MIGDKAAVEKPETATFDEVKEYVGLALAWYQADANRLNGSTFRVNRREHQMMAVCEVLRLIEGDRAAFHELREMGLIPLTLDDLPRRLGGTQDN